MTESRKVAVIAVHGVGLHPPGENQNDMADLLLSLPPRDYSAPRTYGPFHSVSIQIPLAPLKACPFDPPGTANAAEPVPPPTLATRVANLYQEQSADFAYTTRIKASSSAKGVAAGHVSVDTIGEAGRRYTQMLLDNYQGGSDVAGNKYCTARLEGKRIADGTQVHIYEVLWADLAKPNNGLLKFFLGLFQLVLHLASLSRTAIDTGAAEGTTLVWRSYRRCQRYAIRLLQIFAPLLQLLVFVACGSCLSTACDYTRDNPALPLAMGAVAGVLFGLIFINTVQNKIAIGPWLWSLLAVLPGLIGIAIAEGFMRFFSQYHPDPRDSANVTAAVAFWLLPGIGLFYWILRKYDDFRKGAAVTGIVLFAAAFLYFILALKLGMGHVTPPPVDPAHPVPLSHFFVPLAAFWTAKVVLGYLRFCWFLIISLAFVALVLGSIAWRSEQDPGRRARARAAVRTSRFAFALPCISFSLITLAIWASLIHFSSRISTNALFPEAVITAQSPRLSTFSSSPALAWLYHTWQLFAHFTWAQGDDFATSGLLPQTPGALIPAGLAWSAGYQLPVSLALIAIAGFLLAWWALPSALTERFPYRNDAKDRQHAGKAPRDTDNATSIHMGTWLSRGLDSTSVITFLLWCSIFLAPAAWVLLFDLGYHYPTLFGRLLPGLLLLQCSTGTIVYSQVFAATVILAGLARSGGVVLGIVLDVDTYLRDTPREAPPRARIFERYMSTLRYIAHFRDADGHGYDEIVIVAHSLGALISGDLLHFLQSRYSLEEKIPIRIKLLTMGNPTRQLLNRFFPYLYDWIRSEPDNGARPLPAPRLTKPDPIPDAQLPDPHDLGLHHWVSAYRSGDYVGRSLWLDEWYLRTPNDADPRSSPPFLAQSADGTRAEMCIGAGAHTHYMDDTAPDIAVMLDQLISP